MWGKMLISAAEQIKLIMMARIRAVVKSAIMRSLAAIQILLRRLRSEILLFTAARSTITDSVPENSLAIARARQVNKDGWVTEKKPYKNMK